MVGVVSFIIVFSLLIFVHEFGHFIVAKLSKVQVEEFGFGYPPRLLKFGTWRGTAITLNLLPIGGFVRMSEDKPEVKDSLASKGRATRALVYVAGALMNLLLAVVLFTIMFLIGATVQIEGVGAGIYYVAPNSPAEQAGLKPGDTIVQIDGQAVQDATQAGELIRAKVGEPLQMVVQRDGKMLPPMTLTPRVNPPENEGALGVALDLPLTKKAFPIWEAVPRGIMATINVVRGIFTGILAAIQGLLPFQLTGPIGIFRMTSEAAQTGLSQLLEFSGLLSVNLFIFNLLPLPALDGGRLIFVILEWIRGGRKVPPEKEGLVHAVGMMLLLALMVVVSIIDYMRYF